MAEALTHPNSQPQHAFDRAWRYPLLSPGLSLEIAGRATLSNFSAETFNPEIDETVGVLEPESEGLDSAPHSQHEVSRHEIPKSLSDKATPESLIKHTHMVDDSPTSSHHRSVTRALFQGSERGIKGTLDVEEVESDDSEAKQDETNTQSTNECPVVISDTEDGVPTLETNNEIDVEKLLAENEKLTDRNTQLFNAYNEHFDIFTAELAGREMKGRAFQDRIETLEKERDEQTQKRKAEGDELQSLRKENKDLKAERNKHVNTIRKLSNRVESEQGARQQATQLTNEVKLAQHTLKLERRASKQKARKLKATVKGLKRHVVTEKRQYEVAIESAEASHKNELADLRDQQADDLKWANKDHEEKLGKEKEALRTCRGLKKSAETKLSKSKEEFGVVQKDLDQAKYENGQLWEALRIGEEDWKVERVRLYKARIEADVDHKILSDENDYLRRDWEVEPVRKSQWKKLIENKDAVIKRFQQRNGGQEEKIYKQQVTIQVTNEKTKEQTEALVGQLVNTQGLVKDVMTNRESMQKTSKKMLDMLSGHSTFETADGLAAVVERSKLLEQENMNLLTRNDVINRQSGEIRESLVKARHQNTALKQEVVEKTADFEDFESKYVTLECEKQSLKLLVEKVMPKKHAEELKQKDGKIADLELSLASCHQRIQALVQLKADQGFLDALQDKHNALVQLNGQYNQLFKEASDLQKRHGALSDNAACQLEYIDQKEENHERDLRRAIVAEDELNHLRSEMAAGNKELCDPTVWANWSAWKLASIEAKHQQKKAEERAEDAGTRADGLSRLAQLLWRRVFGFEHLLSPSNCPATLSDNRAELVQLSTEFLQLNINASVADEVLDRLNAIEVRDTGAYRGPRYAPRVWKLVSAGRYKNGLRLPNTKQNPPAADPGQVSHMVQEVWNQWTEKIDILNTALMNAPARLPLAIPYQTRGKGLDPQLYNVAQLRGGPEVKF